MYLYGTWTYSKPEMAKGLPTDSIRYLCGAWAYSKGVHGQAMASAIRFAIRSAAALIGSSARWA